MTRSDVMHRTVALGLGGNLDAPADAFCAALTDLSADDRTAVVATSSLFQTEAIGRATAVFTNAAVLVRTDLSLDEVLTQCKAIEQTTGRFETERWEDRLIDIDILWDSASVVEESHLHVPHRLMHVRRFALDPLAEIAPQIVHPTIHRPIDDLVSHWNQRPLRVAIAPALRSYLVDAPTDLLDEIQLVDQQDSFDLCLDRAEADSSAWPPQLDLATWPLPINAAVVAALRGVLDRPTRQLTSWW